MSLDVRAALDVAVQGAPPTRATAAALFRRGQRRRRQHRVAALCAAALVLALTAGIWGLIAPVRGGSPVAAPPDWVSTMSCDQLNRMLVDAAVAAVPGLSSGGGLTPVSTDCHGVTYVIVTLMYQGTALRISLQGGWYVDQPTPPSPCDPTRQIVAVRCETDELSQIGYFDSVELVAAVLQSGQLTVSAGIDQVGIYHAGPLTLDQFGLMARAMAAVLSGPAPTPVPSATPSATPSVTPPTEPSQPRTVGLTCQQFAQRLADAAIAARPGLIVTKVDSFAEVANSDCHNHGLGWFTSTYAGRTFTIGFEGGWYDNKADIAESACDEQRGVTQCDTIPGGQLGRYTSVHDFGALLRRGHVLLYVGFNDPTIEYNGDLTSDDFATMVKAMADAIEVG